MSCHCLVGVGPYATWNLLADPATVITPTNESTTHPKAYLVDGYTSKPFRFLSDGANRQITFDLGSAKAASLFSLHGHNLTTGITEIQIRKSTDNFVGSDELHASILPLYNRSSMYAYRAGTAWRYWRVIFIGTNGSAIWIGEMTLVVARVLSSVPILPSRVEHHESHVRHGTPGGVRQVFARTAWATRYVMTTFEDLLSAHEDAVDVYRTSRGDLYPMLYVPIAPDTYTTVGPGQQAIADNAKVVVLGHLDPPELIEGRQWANMATWSIGVQEDGFPQPLG